MNQAQAKTTMPNPATPHARTLTPSSAPTIATSAVEGTVLYVQIERPSHARLVDELTTMLATRGLALTSEGPGWLVVTRARQLVQGDTCAVVACGGRIQWGACRRCGTKP